jgi:hypothetical protein
MNPTESKVVITLTDKFSPDNPKEAQGVEVLIERGSAWDFIKTGGSSMADRYGFLILQVTKRINTEGHPFINGVKHEKAAWEAVLLNHVWIGFVCGLTSQYAIDLISSSAKASNWPLVALGAFLWLGSFAGFLWAVRAYSKATSMVL